MKKEKTKLGWHVLPASGEIGVGWNGDRRKPKVGKWVRYRGKNNQPTKLPPVVCCRGMHAWNTLKRALIMAQSQARINANTIEGKCWLCRVVVRGSIALDNWDYPDNKFVGEERKIIWKILLTRKEAIYCFNLAKGKNGIKRASREIHRLKRKQKR